jgi:hypothetical protein
MEAFGLSIFWSSLGERKENIVQFVNGCQNADGDEA